MFGNTCSVRGSVSAIVPVIDSLENAVALVPFAGARAGDMVLLSPTVNIVPGGEGFTTLAVDGAVVNPDVLDLTITNIGTVASDGITLGFDVVLLRATGSV